MLAGLRRWGRAEGYRYRQQLFRDYGLQEQQSDFLGNRWDQPLHRWESRYRILFTGCHRFERRLRLQQFSCRLGRPDVKASRSVEARTRPPEKSSPLPSEVPMRTLFIASIVLVF